MAYKCLQCGHIFEEGEQHRLTEYLGEHFGVPCHETMFGCPLCKGDYEKTIPCKICGSEHIFDELNDGVCDDCIDDYKKDFDVCFRVCGEEKTVIKINSLIATLLDEEDINEILYDYIKSNFKDIDCGKFIDEDRQWFAKKLAEEVKKNENAKG